MPARALALIAAGCLTAGWLLASLLMPPVARVQVLPERRATQSLVDAQPVTPFSEQLHLKLRQMPAPPTPRRNPFAFGTRGLRERATDVRVAPEDRPEAPAAPLVVGPIYALSGIATNQTAQGQVHTAVLSDGATVHLVKEGDEIGGYKVVAVTDNAVTLVEASGASHVVRLRN